jgi:hypothetical protein
VKLVVYANRLCGQWNNLGGKIFIKSLKAVIMRYLRTTQLAQFEVFALLAVFYEFQQRQYHFSQNYPRISLEKQSYALVRLNFPTD